MIIEKLTTTVRKHVTHEDDAMPRLYVNISIHLQAVIFG